MSEPRPLQVRVLRGMTANALHFAVNMGAQLILVPVFLARWGNERYGAWLTIQAAVALLVSLDLGHQNYVGALINEAYPVDRERTRFVLGSGVRAAMVIGVVEFVLAASLWATGFGEHVFGWSGTTSEERYAALLILLVPNVLIGSVSTIVFKLYAPAGHYERYVYAIVARRVVDVAAVAAAVMLGYGLSGTALLSALLWLVVAVPQLFALSRSYPEFFPWWRTGTLRTGLENLSRSISFTAVSMLEGLALHGTVLVIGAQLDAPSVTVLLTQRTVANVFQQASTFVLQPLLADFGRFRAQGEWSKLSESFAAYWTVACFCVHAGMLVLLPLVSSLYTTWTRGRSTWEPAVFAGLAIGVIFRMVGAPATSYSLAVNDLRSQAFASASRAAVSLLGALLLTKPFGLVGATAAIAVSEVIGGCLVPGYAVWLRFVDAGARFPLRSLATTLTATGCTCLALFVYVYRPSLTVAVNGAAFAAISGILVVQFRSLGIETSTRIRGLLPRWRRS